MNSKCDKVNDKPRPSGQKGGQSVRFMSAPAPRQRSATFTTSSLLLLLLMEASVSSSNLYLLGSSRTTLDNWTTSDAVSATFLIARGGIED